MQVFNALAPILLLIGIGAALRRGRFAPAEFFAGLNRLVYWVGIPALLFFKCATSMAPLGDVLRLSLVVGGAAFACIVISHLAGRGLGLKRRQHAAYLQAGFRGNLAYVGLPVAIYTVQDMGWPQDRLEPLLLLLLAPMVPLYNVLSVCVLLGAEEHSKGDVAAGWRRLMSGLVTNPLIISCLLGLLVGVLGLEIPKAIGRTCEGLGSMSLPLALIGIGASLDLSTLKGSQWASVTASLIKVVIAPLVGLAIARALDVPPMETRIALIYLSCPTAVLSYVMAEQMGADSDLAARCVVLSTLLSLPVLVVVLFTA